jgi:ubiquinone/menaquinone biosynthesis C-methylase UbiE
MTHRAVKQQWDDIAAENAFYGVLSRDEFENPASVDIGRFWETGNQDADMIMKLAGVEAAGEMTAMELGCGLGRMTHRFAEVFGTVHAVDVSSEMLAQAKSHWRHLSNVNWILGNGEDLRDIPSGSVDYVFSYWVLQHVPSREVVFNYTRESARVLKQGGTAFLQYRLLPSGLNLAAVKYHIITSWPRPVQNVLRAIWDRTHAAKGKRADFARKYDAWRGCAVRGDAVERAAATAGMHVETKGRLGIQSPGTFSGYFVFRKGPGLN